MNNDIQKERLVLENQKLIHHYLQKCRHILPYSEEYDDLFSIGLIGLIKAANTFDASRKIKFSTYAMRCIRNEICMDFRKSNKYKDDISLYEPVDIDNSGNSRLLEDIIEDEKANFIGKLIEQDLLIKVINIIMNFLDYRQKLIMLYYLANYTQAETSLVLNISRSFVSRLQKRAIDKIREILKTGNYFCRFFSIYISDYKYIIEFLTDNITNFNYSVFLQKLNPTSNLSIYQQESRIIIELPIETDSYLFMIKLLQGLEDFTTL